MSLISTYVYALQAWSRQTFGPSKRTVGIIEHIRKELKEIEAKPDDLEEWCDVVILALDGAWRHGHTPAEISSALNEKLRKNMDRKWPDWRTLPDDVPSEHIREVTGQFNKLRLAKWRAGNALSYLRHAGLRAFVKAYVCDALYCAMFPRCTHCGSRKHAARHCVYADERCSHGVRLANPDFYCYQCECDQ